MLGVVLVVLIGARLDAAARPAEGAGTRRALDPAPQTVRVVVEVPPSRAKAPGLTTVFTVTCPPDYTAVAGDVHRLPVAGTPPAPPPKAIVVVASQAGLPGGGIDGWTFEFANQSKRTIKVELVVQCLFDVPAPPRYILVPFPQFRLEPRATRDVRVPGPRFTLPLGAGFRVRSLNGSAPPRGARVDVLTAQPAGGGYRMVIRNVGGQPVRVGISGVFVEARSGGQTLARMRVVSTTRSILRGRSVAAAATCASGLSPVSFGWSSTGTGVDVTGTPTARGFRFGASNTSNATRRVRFFGVCLNVNHVASEAPTVSAINARQQGTSTIYDVETSDPEGAALSITWSKSGSECGQFAPNASRPTQAVWSHPHPPCPAENVHPATITVVVSDGEWRCTATYPFGSAANTGPPPPPCERA